jgi:hypothetical protein
VSAPVPRRGRGLQVFAALLLAGAGLALPAGPGGADDYGALVGGEAIGRGIFATYSDRDTVIDGGTVTAPDFSSPLARAALDLTGLGAGLASLGYSPYSDGAGVINAFAGTSLPVDSFSGASRAKVTGRPPQDQQAAAPGPPGSGARARLTEGPTAEATALAFATPQGQALSVRVGDVRSTVSRAGSTVGSTVSVVLRSVTIGEILTIESITLTSSATADGAAGQAAASSLVEGVAVAGRPVRLTAGGLEPVGAAPPDLGGLTAAGIEVLSAGETTSTPGPNQSDARATGPRIRLRTADGRTLILVLGEALASSEFVPPPGG